MTFQRWLRLQLSSADRDIRTLADDWFGKPACPNHCDGRNHGHVRTKADLIAHIEGHGGFEPAIESAARAWELYVNDRQDREHQKGHDRV